MGGGISSAIARALGARTARGCRRAGLARAGDQSRFRPGVHGARPARRRLAVPRDGRRRRGAGGGAALFRHRVQRRRPAVADERARQRHPRHRQHGGAGHGDLRRRGRARPALALPDLRPRPVPRARRRRRRRGDAALLRRRDQRSSPGICGPAARWCACARARLRAGARSGRSSGSAWWRRWSRCRPSSSSRRRPAYVGRFGTGAIAGYGAGSRLEYLLVPLVFGLGAPLVALVGTNIGAGQRGPGHARGLGRRRRRLRHDRSDRARRRRLPGSLAAPVRRRPGACSRSAAPICG